MKILIVGNYNKGKFNAFVIEQAEELARMGVSVEYFGIKGKGMKGYLKNRKALIEKIDECNPDLIHAHYGLSGLLATLQRKKPVVITFHNGETLSTLPNILSSIAAKRSRYVIYVAEHIRKLSYLKAKNYSIIPCGVNIEDLEITPFDEARKEFGFDDKKKYILFGGAFSNLRKNYPLLKQAVELLKDRYDIECIEMRGMDRSQITKLMCAVDCFALPTKSEGSPQALKEAMGCNCPIVATDVADIKTLLGNVPGHYICTFEPENVADRLVQAFEYGKRTEGRKRILELGLTNDRIAERILKIYESILNNSRK